MTNAQNMRNFLYAGNLTALNIAAVLISTASVTRVIVFQFKGIDIPAFVIYLPIFVRGTEDTLFNCNE